MKKNDNRPYDDLELRRRAEEIAWKKASLSPDNIDSLSPEEAREMLHELRVHQIEMEIQNEELRRTQDELDASRDRYFNLYELAPAGYITVSEKGLILEANLTSANLLKIARGDLVKQPLNHFIFQEDQDTYYRYTKQLFEAHSAGQVNDPAVFELRILCRDGSQFRAHMTAVVAHGTDNAPVCRIVLSDITGRRLAEEALHIALEKYRVLFESFPLGISITDKAGNIVETNRESERLLGISRNEHTLRKFDGHEWHIIHPDGTPMPVEEYASVRALKENRLVENVQMGIVKGNEGITWLNVTAAPIPLDNFGVAITYGDITDHKRTEEALRANEQQYRQMFENMTEGVALHELICNENGEAVDYRLVDTNPAYQRQTGIAPEQARGMLASSLYGTNNPPYLEEFGRVARTGEPIAFETFFAPMDKHFRIAVISPRRGFFATVFDDITGRKRAESEREKLQAQLTQAQKMESVGRLAGGIAHDFNNMLSVILGHTGMALMEVLPTHSIHAHLEEIRTAANRSADLVRQLLAFARKQTIAPKVLDLNETVSGMLRMLHRLIGEDIRLDWLPGKELWRVNVDPSQIDQILANLCVNARDAIAGIGKVTIETGNISFDEAYCAVHAGFAPGDYVVLTVSDNGCGMDRETLGKLFEPFFTTKEVGKGTGLGLATIYGIVRQNDGFINVYSEPGQGTTFSIYLPRYGGKAGQVRTDIESGPAERGCETILLVEDEPAILEMIRQMLKEQGYSVLAANSPGEAVHVAEEHSGDIHLLMTDVIMPEMNGRDLAKKLLVLYPHIKRLFMSGYTSDIIATHGVLDEGVQFIQKPFSIKNLAAKVRQALDQGQTGMKKA